MKIKLLKPHTIQGKTYPANCVIDVYEPDGLRLIADKIGVLMPDGTMARKASYDALGCLPPAGFAKSQAVQSEPPTDSGLRDVFSRLTMEISESDVENKGQGTMKDGPMAPSENETNFFLKAALGDAQNDHGEPKTKKANILKK